MSTGEKKKSDSCTSKKGARTDRRYFVDLRKAFTELNEKIVEFKDVKPEECFETNESGALSDRDKEIWNNTLMYKVVNKADRKCVSREGDTEKLMVFSAFFVHPLQLNWELWVKLSVQAKEKKAPDVIKWMSTVEQEDESSGSDTSSDSDKNTQKNKLMTISKDFILVDRYTIAFFLATDYTGICFDYDELNYVDKMIVYEEKVLMEDRKTIMQKLYTGFKELHRVMVEVKERTKDIAVSMLPKSDNDRDDKENNKDNSEENKKDSKDNVPSTTEEVKNNFEGNADVTQQQQPQEKGDEMEVDALCAKITNIKSGEKMIAIIDRKNFEDMSKKNDLGNTITDVESGLKIEIIDPRLQVDKDSTKDEETNKGKEEKKIMELD